MGDGIQSPEGGWRGDGSHSSIGREEIARLTWWSCWATGLDRIQRRADTLDGEFIALSVRLQPFHSLDQASLSLFTTAAVFVLDSDGHRVLAKYYSPLHPNGLDGKPSLIGGQQGYVNPFKTHKEQRAFEQGVYEKTRKATGALNPFSSL